jgi:hypothetical protein
MINMTPKEKAEELIYRFKKINLATGSFVTEFQIKQCALIAVDEILQIKSVDKDYDLSEFWQEVKEEIEIL